MSERTADLHLHTTASDGTQEISELVKRAAACGLSAIAITDHDTISPALTERVTEIQGIEVITGVEIKVDYDGLRGELLGYFIDPQAASLQALFSSLQRARQERMQRMVKRCIEYLKIDITFEEVRALTTGSVGRPHLAQILVEKGLASSLNEAFQQHLKTGKPCYVSLEKPSYREAVHAISDAGGVAVIPHPCLMEVEDWGRFLQMVHAANIAGIEAFYPYESANGNLSIDPDELRELAEKYGFLLTGGSDDHGPSSVKETLGAIQLPYHYVEALKQVCGLISRDK
jgi:predicted metal-dependent phosphoesterase TrpH